MESKKCTSCGVEVLTQYASFKCPSCGKEEIVRCESCRTGGINYVCRQCGFKGP